MTDYQKNDADYVEDVVSGLIFFRRTTYLKTLATTGTCAVESSGKRNAFQSNLQSVAGEERQGVVHGVPVAAVVLLRVVPAQDAVVGRGPRDQRRRVAAKVALQHHRLAHRRLQLERRRLQTHWAAPGFTFGTEFLFCYTSPGCHRLFLLDVGSFF